MKLTIFVLWGLIAFFAFWLKAIKVYNAKKYSIKAEKGIQEAKYITIGEIKQYIQIRGQSISNPFIIMLHGGPGNNMAYYSYRWQTLLEHKYTIVHWDQRGCGNTYYSNKNAQKPTLELLLTDLEALVTYICAEYKKEKVIIMGHSWGTFLGAVYSIKYPDKVEAYISIGQMLDFKKSEQISAQEAIRLANIAGNHQQTQELQQKLTLVMGFHKFDRQEAMYLLNFRQLKEKYLPAQYPKKMLSLRIFSPYMTFRDFKWMIAFDKLVETNKEIYQELLLKELSLYNYALDYFVPVIIIAGENDWTTPHTMALKYFEDISAPYKKFITIKDAGHIPFLDKPEEFAETLLDALHSL
ncbi:MAG: alpha/beta hydrolase [Lachnospiraceae bacterium]|nr:alpha/beta hydrolase [Lachnospiraceae bacterium]